MGVKHSTLEMHATQLTKDESDHLNELFKTLSNDSPDKGCTYNSFLNFCSVLHPLLTQFVVEFYFGSNRDAFIKTLKEFISFYVHLIRGSVEDRSKVMEVVLLGVLRESPSDIKITGSSYNHQFSTLPINFVTEEHSFKTKLGTYLKGLICSYIQMEYSRNAKEFWSWRKVQSTFTGEDVDKCAVALQSDFHTIQSTEDMQHWVKVWRTTRMLHYTVFSHLFRFEDLTLEPIRSLYPLCAVKHRHHKCLMDLCSVLHINCHLPRKCRTEWDLLFSSGVHGTNFRHLLDRITNEGPTIVVIKDRNGYIFGGYAAESWGPNETFHGNFTSFIFQVRPNLAIYESSGLDNNFQYLSARRSPKGFGMGKGTMDLLGWWIEPERLKGSCAISCSTFHNLPVVASEQVFHIEHFEVWGTDLGKIKKKRHPVTFHRLAPTLGRESNIRTAGKSLFGHSGASHYSDGYKVAAADRKWDQIYEDDEEADANKHPQTHHNSPDDDDEDYDDVDDEDDGDDGVSRTSHASRPSRTAPHRHSRALSLHPVVRHKK